ncbi:MAG: glutathione S-transferase family protein [Alphaproteobacteria bacterium]|nr:glutathione S-transferase family protein [Alphaproteobacteria bacterium]MBU1512778.1 glutathione S-transferase family protein [Alphaproteobacteria bacterium]MBU2096563.1 glutathione S-transferase family protein [Alphaproteobacteria bacterium]MBU2151931.1 glutathione S-transferase family protein [Alphaproteobacteria bacterium]MBU2306441.1 glutathione S-transferase family protein [Alphaproteobacteria bacterium]
MTLTLHSHPLASFCHKVLIGLYEAEVPFEMRLVNLGDPEARAAFVKISPWGKMPVLRDDARDRTVFETSIILEYLEQHYPGPRPLMPADPEARLEMRLWDRIFDLYVQTPMQAAVAATMRGEPDQAAASAAALPTAYDQIEARMAGREWVMGDQFTHADCAAAPALFYASVVAPFGEDRPALSAYFERLIARPSVARVLVEARPYFDMYPLKDRLEPRFL